jgi:hypothetical protein
MKTQLGHVLFAAAELDWSVVGFIYIEVPKPPQDLAMCEARLSGHIAAA